MSAARSPATVRQDFHAAVSLGLITSTFSTIVVSMAAGRIGRDAAVEWMNVACLLLRDAGWETTPQWPVMAVGILIHQSADLMWVLVFFGLLGRWTAPLRPGTIVLLFPAWAVFTSLFEWTVITPLFPFWRAAFPLTQVYWVGFAVHLLSAALYPLFPSLRALLAGQRPVPHRRVGLTWTAGAALLLVGVGGLAVAAANDREPRHLGAESEHDRRYMRRMAAHHEQGVRIARLAESRAGDPHLRALSRLMVASQEGEIAILGRWWRSWFADPPAFVCSASERAAMPGMQSPERLAALERRRGADFDAEFVRMMSEHHRGAVRMADEELHGDGDPRLRLLSHAIRHEQRGEIALMHHVEGLAAVRLAAGAVVDSAGTHPADVPGGWLEGKPD